MSVTVVVTASTHGMLGGPTLPVLALPVLHPRKPLRVGKPEEVGFIVLAAIFTGGNSLSEFQSCPKITQLKKNRAKDQIWAVGVQSFFSSHRSALCHPIVS